MPHSGGQENAFAEEKESHTTPNSQDGPPDEGNDKSKKGSSGSGLPFDHRTLDVMQIAEKAYCIYRERERRMILPKDYLEECNLSLSKRQQAVNWLIEVFRTTFLTPDILALAIAIFDRYVYVKKYCSYPILVAIISLMIAYKMEQDGPYSSMRVCLYYLNNRYSRRRVKKTEQEILKTLDYFLLLPTAFNFLDRCSICLDEDMKHHLLVQYLVEMGLGSYELCHILPSLSAAAASCLMKAILKEEVDLSKIWTSDMVSCTSYTLSRLKPVILIHAQVLTEAINQDINEFMKFEPNYGVSRLKGTGSLINDIVSKL